jgi:hypothetical protein
MERCQGPLNSLTIALHRSIYLAIIMKRYEGPLTSFYIAFHSTIYLAIIMKRYEGHLTSITIVMVVWDPSYRSIIMAK